MNKSSIATNLDLKSENKSRHYSNIVDNLHTKPINRNQFNEINLNLKKLTKIKTFESNPIYETFTTHMK